MHETFFFHPAHEAAELRGGVRAELALQLPDPGGAVLVPRSAVVQRYEEHFVEDEAGERLRVQLLGEEQGLARVRGAGLAPGRRLRAAPAQNGQTPTTAPQAPAQVRQPAGAGSPASAGSPAPRP